MVLELIDGLNVQCSISLASLDSLYSTMELTWRVLLDDWWDERHCLMLAVDSDCWRVSLCLEYHRVTLS